MREIKFRVWNIKDNEWDNPSILEVWTNEGLLEPFKYIKSGELNSIYIPKENYIIQQFTGLKDKNGKEIYEGDILKYRRRGGICEDYLDYINCVTWCEKYLCWSVGEELGFSKVLGSTIEAIGNIFETLDLLKTL